MRGLLPRTFDLDELNANYNDAHLYDSALALMATIGAGRQSLAHEIAMGIVASQFNDGGIPVMVDGEVAATSSDYVRNNATAMAAYALGFYLETYPSTPDSCTIIATLRHILNYLESKRDFVNCFGLITGGVDSLSADITDAYTEDNLLSYFAFKQAGIIFGESNYTNTAIELETVLQSELFDGTKFIYGLDATGSTLSGNLLINQVLGALFFLELGNTSNAQILLVQTDSYKTVDGTNGASGYKCTSTSGDVVWFEGSYAVALAYSKLGNSVLYKRVIKELNKYIDTTDGGVLGTILKDNNYDGMVNYKAIGSTAWAIITNLLKSSAFQTRALATPLTGCPVPYFNVLQFDTATKQGCATGYTASTETYTVRAGRYISYIDQTTANNIAIADVNANKQAYANAVGTCTGTVGNTQQSDFFFSSVCPSGTTPDSYQYIVPANRYFASDLASANALAMADVLANGQAAADASGTCSLTTLTITITPITTVYGFGSTDDVYVEYQTDQPVTDDIIIKAKAVDAVSGLQWILPMTSLSTGSSVTSQEYVGSVAAGDGFNVSVQIIQVIPNPDSAGSTYTW